MNGVPDLTCEAFRERYVDQRVTHEGSSRSRLQWKIEWSMRRHAFGLTPEMREDIASAVFKDILDRGGNIVAKFHASGRAANLANFDAWLTVSIRNSVYDALRRKPDPPIDIGDQLDVLDETRPPIHI